MTDMRFAAQRAIRWIALRAVLASLAATSSLWTLPAASQEATNVVPRGTLETFLETVVKRPIFPTRLSILKAVGDLDDALRRMPLTGDGRRLSEYCAIARERARVEVEVKGYLNTPQQVLLDAWNTCRLNYALAWIRLRQEAFGRPAVAGLPE